MKGGVEIKKQWVKRTFLAAVFSTSGLLSLLSLHRHLLGVGSEDGEKAWQPATEVGGNSLDFSAC